MKTSTNGSIATLIRAQLSADHGEANISRATGMELDALMPSGTTATGSINAVTAPLQVTMIKVSTITLNAGRTPNLCAKMQTLQVTTMIVTSTAMAAQTLSGTIATGMAHAMAQLILLISTLSGNGSNATRPHTTHVVRTILKTTNATGTMRDAKIHGGMIASGTLKTATRCSMLRI